MELQADGEQVDFNVDDLTRYEFFGPVEVCKLG